MLYLMNPRKRGKAKRKKRRTAKQRAATKKMLAAAKRARAGKKSRSRTHTRSTSMARKARKRGTSRKRRRSSHRRKGAGVRLVRRGQTVYQGNPRRRRSHRRRRGYHRNPSIIGIVKQGVMDAGVTLAGGAAARVVTGFIPLADTGLMGTAKGVLVAVGIGIGARKFLGSDVARFVTAGAMQVPLKNLFTSFVPQAGAFLGDYDNMSAYLAGEEDAGAVTGYLTDVGAAGGDSGMGEMYEGVGGYVESY